MYISVFGAHAFGEQLVLRHEEDNEHDIRAVAIVEDNTVIGHMPCETARTVWFFLMQGGSAVCEVTGRKKGKGVEVPCVYQVERFA